MSEVPGGMVLRIMWVVSLVGMLTHGIGIVGIMGECGL